MHIKSLIAIAALSAISLTHIAHAAVATPTTVNAAGVLITPNNALPPGTNFAASGGGLTFTRGGSPAVASGDFGFISLGNNHLSCATPGCNLSLSFGGFQSISGGTNTPSEVFRLGRVTLQLNGMDWLILDGHALAPTGRTATAQYITDIDFFTGAPQYGVNFRGLLDVVGGAAASYFNTNQRADGADLSFAFTWATGNCSTFDNCAAGGISLSGLVRNDVPEPGSMALFGLGLLGFGAASARRRKG